MICFWNGIRMAPLSLFFCTAWRTPDSRHRRLCSSVKYSPWVFVETLAKPIFIGILCKSIFDYFIAKMMPIRPNSWIIGQVPRSMSSSTGISSLHAEEIKSELRHGFREQPSHDFKPSLRLYLAFLTLAVITMAVALDGTSLSVALPVGSRLTSLFD